MHWLQNYSIFFIKFDVVVFGRFESGSKHSGSTKGVTRLYLYDGNKWEINDNLIHIELFVSYMSSDGDYVYEMIIYKVIMVIPNEVRWHCISFILYALHCTGKS